MMLSNGKNTAVAWVRYTQGDSWEVSWRKERDRTCKEEYRYQHHRHRQRWWWHNNCWIDARMLCPGRIWYAASPVRSNACMHVHAVCMYVHTYMVLCVAHACSRLQAVSKHSVADARLEESVVFFYCMEAWNWLKWAGAWIRIIRSDCVAS